MNWEELQQSGATEIAGAVSGGLDSCTVANWLKNKGFKVHCFTVDLGQPDEENLDAVTNRMIDCGAHKADILPGLEKLADVPVPFAEPLSPVPASVVTAPVDITILRIV